MKAVDFNRFLIAVAVNVRYCCKENIIYDTLINSRLIYFWRDNSPVERKKGLTTNHVYIQSDHFTSQLSNYVFY